jgi:ATP-dependent RNA helicase DDX5/DBP2
MSKLPQVVKNIYVEHDEVKHMPIAEVTKWRNQHDMTIFGRDCPNPILTFDQAPFRDFARRELKRIFAAPTIIQSQGWPVAMHGRDMVGSAMTGSGKTLSFILPALEHIAAQQAALGEDAVSPAMRRHGDVRSDPIALILAPTRELAMQIHDEAQRYARGYNIRIACLYGGQGNRGTQAQQLRGRPHLIVATPGRLMDFVGEGLTTLRRTSFWVMDEADRMLDMGFEPQIRAIGEQIRPERQVLMWSATWPKKIQALAAEFLKDPIRVRIGSDELTVNKNVEQRFEICDPYSRFPRILDFIRAQPIGTKILIFASTKSSTEWLGDELYREGIDTVVLHGDKAQTHRTRALEQFKSNNVSVLVATDVAARGLHVNDINVVINYEFPPDFENYIHRIGRTGRAGKSGLSISYISSKDFQHLQDIVQVLKEAGQPIPDEIRNALRDQERGRSGNRGGGGGGGRPSFRGGSDRRGDSRNFSRGGGRSGGGRGGGRSGRPSSQDRDEDW